MKTIYFITGSQDLYGEEVLTRVASDSKEIVAFLQNKLKDTIKLKYVAPAINSEAIIDVCQRASVDSNCVGVIAWMRTFSPAKMWIKGLQRLTKPLLHLHTQYNEKIPYDAIDMDYMNINQSAHGDREFGFILKRLNIAHDIVVGYYKHKQTIEAIARFCRVAKAIDYSRSLKVAMFGSNMREVAVTDGDRVESQIKYGWEVNYYGIGDLVELVSQVTDKEVSDKMAEYAQKYDIATDNVEAVKEQARYEVALRKFLSATGANAFCDTFQDLRGLNQLPGLAVQNLMGDGIGFAAEGDYKTAALSAVFMKMSEGVKGSTGFMEDYTYDLSEGQEVVLGSHMLEVSPSFAATKPKIEVHPLGIGGKSDPARLVFDGVTGNGLQVSMLDEGCDFRLVSAQIELVKQPKPMPRLPVARVMWKIKPNFKSGVKAWLESGAGHHSVVTTALTEEDVALFAKLTSTSLTLIG
ncbi:MAG: L-arabinose isomerase [Clostridiales bacterium]|nr:L-arabinose isomerase [Clostridiales bacterium]